MRLYKMRLGSGLALALPVLLVVAWYAASAFADIDRYRRATKDAPPLDAELFQIALHDQFVRDWRRMTLPSRPPDSPMPTFEVSLSRESLDLLSDTGAKGDGAAGYAPALLRVRRKAYDIHVRYRGGQHWHWIGAQKSMKIRLDKGDLFDGTRVFNLLNDVTPFGLEDQIILDLARESGLLTPEYFPVWVRFNNTDMGVYRYEAQPEEGLLRRNHRIPGSMYSGDSEARSPSGEGGLFWDAAGWSKIAWKDEEHKEDRAELDPFLHAIAAGTQREFATYAAENIDLERYAAFDALDVVFGGNDHDWFSNHKFYVDPYRGKIEPVAWGFRAFQNEPRLNLVDNPMLLRLKMTPGYLALRNRAVYDLLVGKAAVPEVRARANRIFAELAPDLDADLWWDAYKLLPRVTRFHRFMVRPMSKAAWVRASTDELSGYARRNRSLLDRLEAPGIRASPARRGALAVAQIVVDGDAAYRLRSASVKAPCEGAFDLFADDDRETLVAHGRMGATVASAATGRVDLESGIVLVPRDDPQPKHGSVLAETDPRRYRYFVSAPCQPSSLELELDNRTTGGSRRLSVAFAGAAEDPVEPTTVPRFAEAVPRFAAGEVSMHPWEMPPAPRPQEVTLGPGRVVVATTRVFGPNETVRVLPGTEFAMGAGASLVFHGRVTMDVARLVPLLAGKPHGGLVIEGKAAAGARLSHVTVTGATRPSLPPAEYTGAVNIHDTSDIEIDGLLVEMATGVDDAVHAVYVDGLRLNDVTVRGAPTDAIDLEFVKGDARGLRIAGAGDDCLDLMGTSLRLEDSILSGCANNGISAGEETSVVAHGVLLSDGKTGVLAKNASSVQLSRSLVYRAHTALETHLREVHYSGGSAIGAQDLFVVDCDSIVDAKDGTTVDPGFVRTSFDGGGLDYLRDEVLHLREWNDLPRALQRLREEP